MKSVFKSIKSIIPKISNTELIALRSGTTSLDREIFKGKVILPNKNHNKLSNIENDFYNKKSDVMLKKYGDKIAFDVNNPNSNIVKDFSKNKFFSFIIDEKYGGNKLSVNAQSKILTKLASKNPSLGVVTMVPNSLGPGELLSEYGTDAQKNKYLKKLANGDYIPCFGLTGPNNGSDAAGAIDKGVLKSDGKNRYIDISLNKRYITLAPVSNLAGIAFKLEDPDNLLENGTEGITVALLELPYDGLTNNTCHNPLNAGFPNGTLKGNIRINIDNVIGGEEQIGNGWKMLMECLAAGRAVSLPASAMAAANVSTFGVLNYSKHRKQFGIPLIKMEGVREKLSNMLFHTLAIQSGISLTNLLLDQGERPAVISAIMKYYATENARHVLNDAMDIYAGSGICLGENNFLEKYYKSAPVGITVEGSNTLTRSLIIFGQGLNKSHPFIYPILNDILSDDVNSFSKNFRNIIGHSMSMLSKSVVSNVYNSNDQSRQLDKLTQKFANLSNFVALLGSRIKANQMLSGKMADILSDIYIGHSMIWFCKNNNISNDVLNYCLRRINHQIQTNINCVVENYPNNLDKILKVSCVKNPSNISFDEINKFVDNAAYDNNLIDVIKKDIYLEEGDILSNLDILNTIKDEKKYNEIYNKVISVAEYEC